MPIVMFAGTSGQPATWLPNGEGFNNFSMLWLDEQGRFVDLDARNTAHPVDPSQLTRFLRRKIVLPKGITDVFVWVHGWQNDDARAVATARRLFANLSAWFAASSNASRDARKIVPAFVAVHWPSTSAPGMFGYRRIRNRARAMTTEGEAEFFLASLLGYLDEGNARAPERKVLAAKGGFFIHCLGHSFGGRFLVAAIKAAASPTERSRKLLAAAHRQTRFEFTVDSLVVLQMAASTKAFAGEFLQLLDEAALSGPVVLTHSHHDRALCLWHRLSEAGQAGIGCHGAAEPRNRIGNIAMRDATRSYGDDDFATDITNVDASSYYRRGGAAEGAHSDFWRPETLHLIASVTSQVGAHVAHASR